MPSPTRLSFLLFGEPHVYIGRDASVPRLPIFQFFLVACIRPCAYGLSCRQGETLISISGICCDKQFLWSRTFSARIFPQTVEEQIRNLVSFLPLSVSPPAIQRGYPTPHQPQPTARLLSVLLNHRPARGTARTEPGTPSCNTTLIDNGRLTCQSSHDTVTVGSATAEAPQPFKAIRKTKDGATAHSALPNLPIRPMCWSRFYPSPFEAETNANVNQGSPLSISG